MAAAATAQADNPPSERQLTQEQLVVLLENAHHLFAWWKHFQGDIEAIGKSAAYKAHDSFAHLNFSTQKVAAALGYELPDRDSYDWAPKRRLPAED